MSPSRDVLRQSAVFRNCTEEQFSAFLQAGVDRAVEEDGFFFQQGDPAARLFVLTGGRGLLSQVTPDGQEVGLRLLVPGQLFGAIGLTDEAAAYPASARALEDSQALSWEPDAFRRLAQGLPQVNANLLGLMALYLQDMQDRYRDLATQRVEQRLARAVLRLAAQVGQATEAGLLIDLALTRQDLARMAGTTLFTASRLLADWERRGLIQAGRERIVITDPHGLVRIAEDLPG